MLTARVGEIVAEHFGGTMSAFLADNGCSTGDIQRWVAHPGGPKVLEAFSDSLRLPAGALDISWRSLAAVGNLSSVSVLHILAESIADGEHPAGENTVLFALGPGISAELVLMRWPE